MYLISWVEEGIKMTLAHDEKLDGNIEGYKNSSFYEVREVKNIENYINSKDD